MFSYTGITVDVDPDIADAVSDSTKQAKRKFKALYRKAVEPLAQSAIRRLAIVPPKPRYPLRWKTEKQRRAFFATDGFGQGIPTKRTGKLQKGWKYELIADFEQGLFTVYNDATTRNYFTGAVTFYEIFVQGEFQQPFHADTGYPRSQDVLADVLVEAEDAIIKIWGEANDIT